MILSIQYQLNAKSPLVRIISRDACNPLLLMSTQDSKFVSDFLSTVQILAQSTRKKAMTQE